MTAWNDNTIKRSEIDYDGLRWWINYHRRRDKITRRARLSRIQIL